MRYREKLKIVHVFFSDDEGGAAIAANRIHKAMLDEGINSKLYVSKKSSDGINIFTKEKENIFNKLSINFRSFVGHFLRKIGKSINGKHLPPVELLSLLILKSNWYKFLNSLDADIINFHWIGNEMMSISEFQKIKKPIVFTLHDMWLFTGVEHYSNDDRWITGYPDKKDLNWLIWRYKKLKIKREINIIAPSKWLYNSVKKSMLGKNWNTINIPYCIDLQKWSPANKNYSRDVLKLPKNKKLILLGAAGGLSDPRKGYDLEIKAIKNLNKNKENYEIVIFGQSNQKEKYFGELSVSFLGKIRDEFTMILIYSACDIFVLPSRQDNLPLTGIESMACALPIVGFNIGGIPDIIDHKKNGFIAKPFCIKNLTDGISYLLTKNNIMSLNARKKIVELCNQKKIINSYINFYKSLKK